MDPSRGLHLSSTFQAVSAELALQPEHDSTRTPQTMSSANLVHQALSVRICSIFLMRVRMDMSMCFSPTSMMSPPMMAGSTCKSMFQ